MFLSYDHLIYMVPDLDDAAKTFAAQGFAITERADVEPGATENRLVCFADGSYIELVRFVDPQMLAGHRFAPLQNLWGWAEHVITTDSLTEDQARLEAAGIPISPLRSVSKALRDGQAWRVDLVYAGRGIGSPLLPMMAQDRTPHFLRVPNHDVVHPNGATGIAGVTLAARETAGILPKLETLFGPAVAPGRFAFQGRWLQVIEADPGKRGDGIVGVTIATGHEPMTIPNP